MFLAFCLFDLIRTKLGTNSRKASRKKKDLKHIAIQRALRAQENRQGIGRRKKKEK